MRRYTTYPSDLAVTYMTSRGCRVSTESAYLTPDVRKRKNLTVAVGAHATRILVEGIDGVEGEVKARNSNTLLSMGLQMQMGSQLDQICGCESQGRTMISTHVLDVRRGKER